MRRGGRVLLLDNANRVLLVGSINPQPGAVVWVPPGGRAEADEDHRIAAARELHEETGLRLEPADLGDAVATSVGPGYEEAFFVVRVRSPFLPSGANPDASERLVWTDFQWWSSSEIRATSDIVFPNGLADLLDAIERDGPPLSPRQLPWRSSG